MLRGFFGLSVIVFLYILLQKYTAFDGFIDRIGQWPLLVYGVFTVSEVVFGIIPPELFMIWSIKHGLFNTYFLNILFLTIISYTAGVVGYNIGANASTMSWLETAMRKYVYRYRNTLNKFGGLLILVGAVTPIPFSAVCMLVGATGFPFPKFLFIALARFVRFIVYAAVIYQANI
ncbi:MAG: hypothetical protein AAF519_05265 [Bacteroidota bacterium]